VQGFCIILRGNEHWVSQDNKNQNAFGEHGSTPDSAGGVYSFLAIYSFDLSGLAFFASAGRKPPYAIGVHWQS